MIRYAIYLSYVREQPPPAKKTKISKFSKFSNFLHPGFALRGGYPSDIHRGMIPSPGAQTCRTVCSILSRYAWNYIALHEGCHRSVGGITSRCAWAAIELFVC